MRKLWAGKPAHIGVTGLLALCLAALLAGCLGARPEQGPTVPMEMEGFAMIWRNRWLEDRLHVGTGVRIAARYEVEIIDEPGYLGVIRDRSAVVVAGPGGAFRFEELATGGSSQTTRVTLRRGEMYLGLGPPAGDEPGGGSRLIAETPLGDVRLEAGAENPAALVAYDPEAGLLSVACLRGEATLELRAGRTILGAGTQAQVSGRRQVAEVRAFDGLPDTAGPEIRARIEEELAE